MSALRGLIIIVLGLAVALGTNIMVGIKGWGLEPQSWWWITMGHLFGQITALILIDIGKHNEKR